MIESTLNRIEELTKQVEQVVANYNLLSGMLQEARRFYDELVSTQNKMADSPAIIDATFEDVKQ